MGSRLLSAALPLLAAVIAAGVVGCSPSPEAAKQPEGTPVATGDKKAIKITLIAKSSNNPVFMSAKVGAEAAAKELGEKSGRTITVDWRTPNEEDGQVQAQRIAQAVNDGTDAIILAASDAAKVKGAVDDAVAKNVPVFTFDSDVAGSKRFGFYGADDMAVGKQVMDELAKIAGSGPVNVAILAGNQNAPNLQKRVEGVKEAAKAYPNVKIVSVVNHVESPQDASAAVTREMNAKPEINAWAMIGGWPLFNTSLLTLDPAKVKIVAVDALPAQLAYVEKGIAPVLLAQPIYDWGYKSVGFVVDKLDGKEVAEMNKMDLIRVSKDNLNDWAKQLQKWGMTDIDPKFLK
jgi:ribose transport system substrate-binding protein